MAVSKLTRLERQALKGLRQRLGLPTAKSQRYCEMCDTWVSKRECPACGADTQPQRK